MLEKVYAFVKQLDPHHPMTMAFCCCDPLTYKDAFDIGMSTTAATHLSPLFYAPWQQTPAANGCASSQFP